MASFNYDKDIAIDNNLAKIADATSLDNFTTSSKIRLLTEILANDVTNFVDFVNESKKDMYLSSASGSALDVKAADLNVFRRQKESLMILAEDKIASLETVETDLVFGDISSSQIVLEEGEELKGSNNIKITLGSTILLDPLKREQYLDLQLEPSDFSRGFSIKAGEVFKLPQVILGSSGFANRLQIRFHKPISISTFDEGDEQLRARASILRGSPSTAVHESIVAKILSLPDLSGFSVFKNARGFGSIDVGFTTKTLENLGADSNVLILARLLESKLFSVVAEGVDIECFTPSPVEVGIEYSYASEIDLDESIKSSLASVIKSTYRYSEINSIDRFRLEELVMDKVSDLNSFSIERMYLYDPEMDDFIATGSNELVAPKDSFIFVNKDRFSKV